METVAYANLADVVVASVKRAWQQQSGRRIEVNTPTDPIWVQAEADLLDRIVRELVTNAGDAVADGGQVRVHVELVTLAAPVPRSHPGLERPIPPGRYARLSVTDDGPGVPPDVWPRLFQPFVSTKSPGLGRGMGLATVYGTALAVGWWVDVESQPGRTVFSLFFPTSTQPRPDGLG